MYRSLKFIYLVGKEKLVCLFKTKLTYVDEYIPCKKKKIIINKILNLRSGEVDMATNENAYGI